ncbi:D-beta-hydroxybutyrate dehydrogenase, mitochondrial [Nilaparvata lugens]|nr:D-beta-hydroxybutyrate dehydrogenase, mitochondrial [Nilaparvata lugens]
MRFSVSRETLLDQCATPASADDKVYQVPCSQRACSLFTLVSLFLIWLMAFQVWRLFGTQKSAVLSTMGSAVTKQFSPLTPSVHHNQFLPSGKLIVAAASASLFVLYRRFSTSHKSLEAKRCDVVLVTGCDSGIGYSAAKHCHNLGFSVVASVIDLQSAGAMSLRKLDNKCMSVIKLDLKNSSDISSCVEHVRSLIAENSDYRLHAIVNNAGIMIFGELEWQVEDMIRNQIEVNLLAPIYLTKSFMPLLRKHKGRVINVSSHCALEALPGLSSYCASKAGLQAFNNSLRVECAKFGVGVISLVPGSFFDQTKILSKQPEHASRMHEGMSAECKDFYGEYFHVYHSYLAAVSNLQRNETVKEVDDANLYRNFTDALTSINPKALYKNSPWYYEAHHLLFKVLPTSWRDQLVVRFMRMPKFQVSAS